MRLVLFGVLLISLSALGQPAQKPDAKAFVGAVTDRVAPLAKAMALNYWEATATGKQEL